MPPKPDKPEPEASLRPLCESLGAKVEAHLDSDRATELSYYEPDLLEFFKPYDALITRLRAENRRLREALKGVLAECESYIHDEYDGTGGVERRLADPALTEARDALSAAEASGEGSS